MDKSILTLNIKEYLFFILTFYQGCYYRIIKQQRWKVPLPSFITCNDYNQLYKAILLSPGSVLNCTKANSIQNMYIQFPE